MSAVFRNLLKPWSSPIIPLRRSKTWFVTMGDHADRGSLIATLMANHIFVTGPGMLGFEVKPSQESYKTLLVGHTAASLGLVENANFRDVRVQALGRGHALCSPEQALRLPLENDLLPGEVLHVPVSSGKNDLELLYTIWSSERKVFIQGDFVDSLKNHYRPENTIVFVSR